MTTCRFFKNNRKLLEISRVRSLINRCLFDGPFGLVTTYRSESLFISSDEDLARLLIRLISTNQLYSSSYDYLLNYLFDWMMHNRAELWHLVTAH